MLRRITAETESFLNRGDYRMWVLVAVDLATAVAGGWILWANSAGQTVADPTVPGTAIFIVVSALLLNLRRFVAEPVQGKPVAHPRTGNALTRTQVFCCARDAMLVILAAASVSMTMYFAQWLVSYAALVATASGTGRVLLHLISGSARHRMVLPAVTTVAGVLGLVLTRQVHHGNFAMLGFIALLLLIADVSGRVFSYWYEIVIGTIPPEPDHRPRKPARTVSPDPDTRADANRYHA